MHQTRTAWICITTDEGHQGAEIWNPNRAWPSREGPEAARGAEEFAQNIHILVGSSSRLPACCESSGCCTGIVFYVSEALSPFSDEKKREKGGAGGPWKPQPRAQTALGSSWQELRAPTALPWLLLGADSKARLL